MGGYYVIRKEAGLSCRTSSSVRLWWELEEPKGPINGFGGMQWQSSVISHLVTIPPRVDNFWVVNFWVVLGCSKGTARCTGLRVQGLLGIKDTHRPMVLR